MTNFKVYRGWLNKDVIALNEDPQEKHQKTLLLTTGVATLATAIPLVATTANVSDGLMTIALTGALVYLTGCFAIDDFDRNRKRRLTTKINDFLESFNFNNGTEISLDDLLKRSIFDKGVSTQTTATNDGNVNVVTKTTHITYVYKNGIDQAPIILEQTRANRIYDEAEETNGEIRLLNGEVGRFFNIAKPTHPDDVARVLARKEPTLY